MEEYVAHMQSTLARRRAEAEELSRELRPYAETLLSDITSCQLDEMMNLTTTSRAASTRS
jgi:hypothetical protein